MSSVRHGKLPGPEDRDRNNPMAATVVVAGWRGGHREGVFTDPGYWFGSSWEQVWGCG